MELCIKFKKNKFDVVKFIKKNCNCKDKKFFNNLLNSFDSEICGNKMFIDAYKNFKKIAGEDLKKHILEIKEKNIIKELKAKELKKYIKEIIPLRRDFFIGQNLELNLIKIIQYLQIKIDELYLLDCYRREKLLAIEILKQIEQIREEVYKFNKNAEIELNFFFKNYTTKPLMSWKLSEEGENEQFGLETTDMLKSK